MSELLSIGDLCRLFGVHKSTIWRLVKAGKLSPPLKISTQCRRWEPSAVDEALQEMRGRSLASLTPIPMPDLSKGRAV
jgi:predicted DNA-binding transcriptional regulator AlpA